MEDMDKQVSTREEFQVVPSCYPLFVQWDIAGGIDPQRSMGSA